jgi:hypothetical protein
MKKQPKSKKQKPFFYELELYVIDDKKKSKFYTIENVNGKRVRKSL